LDQSQNANHADSLKPNGDASAPSPPPADAAPPLTPAAWLMNNAVYILIIGAIIGLIWYKLGLDSVWTVAKVVVGLGFVIFIHELGHFLAAKWCDVHVQTFSIGFGPALPGCSFQRGETTYKIAVLPLGGYVNMVGEGLEAEEDESYPRSFKNKSVGQRMLIISAGVIMNVLLGCVLFIAVYYYNGVEQVPAVVGSVDPGSPMWEKGIPTGSLITDLDAIHNPVFRNLQVTVVLSGRDERIPFTFAMFGPEGEKLGERSVDLLPRREENDPNPIVGVSPVEQLRLSPRPKKDTGYQPFYSGSAAAAARPVPVEPNEVVVAATDPDDPDKVTPIRHDLKSGTFNYGELGRRLRRLEGKKLVVHVKRRGDDEKDKADERGVPLEGFRFNDTIIGCTKPQQERGDSCNPFLVEALPHDPRHEGGDHRDPFAFRNRQRLLAGLPMVVQVRRGDPNNTSLRDEPASGEVVNLFVPPAFHVTFGMRMKMGKVAGLRENSPAVRVRLQKGDELIKVALLDEQGKVVERWEELDPERLPDQLARKAAETPGKKKVVLTVRRGPSEENHKAKDITLEPADWDDRWDNDDEIPMSASSPLAIPQLGLAYRILSTIVEVQKGSPAAEARLEKDGSPAPLRKEDTLKEYRIKTLSAFSKEPTWSDWVPLESTRGGDKQFDCWARAFYFLPFNDFHEIQVRVNRPGEELKDAIVLTAREERDWPLVSRGLKFQPDYKLQKADSLGEALVLGGRETRDWLGIMYMQLRSLATGRVSFKKAGGPIAILSQGFVHAYSGNWELLSFLAVISINLAVVNFLPIPILDGGHMVFLIYEKLRGRPPTEKVRAVATYIGLAMIGFLMIFVFYQDFQNYVKSWLSGFGI
jgi:membrane-associated protease RseP (regulator of RpoE activity)